MNPNPHTIRILAIDPGTRELGFAVLSGSQLQHYGVKTITRRESPLSILLHGKAIVYRLITAHRPGVLAIEKPFLGYGNRSAVLVSLYKEITKLGRDFGIEIREIGPSSMKKAITGNGAAKKIEIARQLCKRFPELQAHLEQTLKSKERYWANMFDAVAIAVATTLIL